MFRIWRGTYDRDAAAELATLVLVFAVLAIGLERILRGRARFGRAGGQDAGIPPRRLRGWRAVAATVGCAAVVVLGFGAPTAQLAVWAIREQTGNRGTPVVDRYLDFLGNSLVLTLTTVVICLVVAVLVTNARRFGAERTVAPANRLTAIGYAVPGPVVAMGVVLAVVALDDLLDGVGLGLPGAVATGSFVALAYAYAIRFVGPALGTVEAGLGQVTDEVTASARSLGAPPRVVLGRIHLPLSRASIITAAVLVGVDALKELPIALLLRPIGFDTLAGLGLQPRLREPVRAGRAPGDHDHRRGADPGGHPLSSARPSSRRLHPSTRSGGVSACERTVGRCAGVSSARCSSTGSPSRSGRPWPSTTSTMELAGNELLALVGPSGCGKSTLLRLVAGLVGVDRGTIRIGATLVDDGTRRVDPERRRIGLVFQEHALFPHLTVAQNVAFGLRNVPRAERRPARRPMARSRRPRRLRPPLPARAVRR